MEHGGTYDNAILKILQQTYNIYADDSHEITKFSLNRLMFENKLIDVCDFDIFYINDLMHQLCPETEYINYEKYINMIFFIYSQQNQKPRQTEENQEENIKSDEGSINDIVEMSHESIGKIVNNRYMINSHSNIVKILVDLKEKEKKFLDLCTPQFHLEQIATLFDTSILECVKPYSVEIKQNIFNQFAKKDEEKNISYINILEFHDFLFQFPIYSNFDCEIITNVVSKFMFPLKIEKLKFELQSIFDEKSTKEELKHKLNDIDLDPHHLNFTFSTFVLCLVLFALQLKDTKSPEEAIDYFFQEKLGLTSKYVIEIPMIEVSVEEEEEEYFPESETFIEAIGLQSNPSKDEELYLHENLLTLDKELPEIPLEIKSMQNPVSNQSNTLFYNQLKVEPVKFPLNILQVEIDEMNAKKLEIREKMELERAKKGGKSNPKDALSKPVWYEDLPDQKLENEKVFGNKPVNDLKGRLMKNSYKDVLNNSAVFPSIIKEVLLIPEAIPQDVIETIILAFKDQIIGNTELAIRKLERAHKEFLSYKLMNTQVDLFFSLTFGSFYESLELNMMALRYYLRAKLSSERFYNYDPDTALSFCFLGSLLIRLREYDWALRLFLKAKDIRENSIGGDALDTATVYNNLGVCCFMLQCYYPAKGFFQLSYEIYKKHFGMFHQRTIFIKSNLSKLNHLNFNKPFEYKSPALYQTLKYMMDNPKKAKKK